MQVRDFALQVLHGTTLTDKLLSVEGLVDTAPGAPITTPELPGRPAGWAPTSERVPFPRPGDLERHPELRGRVLHFFANHELLAIEVMALMLLKLPEAPRSFRRGLLHTLAEEQTHLSLYLERMKELGTEPGSVPVNDFLWRSLCTIRDTADYGARMGLVFEQANLDHAKAWRGVFQDLGDPRTAAILDQVWREEIGHVRQGLRWFSAGQPEGADLWQCFTEHLETPLTPARAKGAPLDVEGRRRAGLSDEWIRQLRLYRHSRGRPPRVWWLDPEIESSIAGSAPSRMGAAVGAALQLVPAVLAAEDDVVLVQKRPSTAFLEHWVSTGLPLPELVELPPEGLHQHALATRTLGPLRPWGWSPHTCEVLAPLGASPWTEHAGHALGKHQAVALRRELDLGPGLVVSSEAELLQHTESTEGPVLWKAPWGTAGRGRRHIDSTPSEPDLGWARRVLRQQGHVVVEPWEDRLLDFSVQLRVRAGGSIELGSPRRFFTDRTGRYVGASLSRLQHGLSEELRRFVYGEAALQATLKRTQQAVGQQLAARGYTGWAGIDGMVVRTASGPALRPLVEVNTRLTFGRVAEALAPRVAASSRGCLVLVGPSEARRAAVESPNAVVQSWPALEQNSAGWTRGVVPLSDPNAPTSLLPVVVIGRDDQELEALVARVLPSSTGTADPA